MKLQLKFSNIVDIIPLLETKNTKRVYGFNLKVLFIEMVFYKNKK